jgi:PAS domain S-box-containing protein
MRQFPAMDGAGATGAIADGALTELARELRAIRDGRRARLELSEDGAMGEVAALMNELLGQGEARRQEAVLQYIIEHVPHSIFWKDREGRFLGGNRNLLRDVGLHGLHELLGKTDYDLGFPREQVDHFRKCDVEVMTTGEPLLDIEESQDQADGTHTLLTSKVPLRGEGGRVIGLLGIYVDITERKRMEEQLRQARDAAEAASRAKGEFLTVMSHELRTPLTLILAPLDTLLAGRDLPAEVREQLERMRRNAGRLLTLVNDILDASLIEAGRMKVDREPVDVAELCGQLVGDAGPAAERAGLALRFEAHGHGTAAIDRRKFEKILVNLLGNALKFTPAGGEVVVSLHVCDDVELSVRDTGPGIAPEKQALLFRRFQQLDGSSTRRHEGTGIGLAMVKELAELMGGVAGVESGLGQGSRFFVRLPRGAAAAPPELVERPPAPRAAFEAAPVSTPVPPAADTARPPLLVAEDNADMRAYLAQILGADYLVEAVENGRLALEAARARPPSVIVSDVMMPEMDGFELVSRLKQDPALQRVPVILLTAKTARAELVAGLDVGADDYLAKPFSPEELTARVRAVRRLHDAYAELAHRHDELTAAHAQLRRTQEELLQSAKIGALGTLAAGLSHELNTPLGVVLMNTQFLLSRLHDPLERKSLQLIERHTQRCAQLVVSLLDFVRKKPAVRQRLVAEPMIERVLALGSTRARRAGVELTAGTEGTALLPAVEATVQEIETALLNLVNNALDATPPGGKVTLVAAKRERDGRLGLELTVRDTGPGIPPEILPHVFDPFFTTKPAGQGTGLGLAITRRVAEDHRGRIDIESGPQGTTVRLWLPAALGLPIAPRSGTP